MRRARPAERDARERALVIYDGDCSFCRRSVDWLRWIDRDCRLEFVPLQRDDAPALAGVPREELRRAAYLVTPEGSIERGAEAIRAAFGYVPGGWIIRFVMGLPLIRQAANLIYEWIANNRHLF